MTRVLVCGAYGKMGRAVLRAVQEEADLTLVGAVDVMSEGDDVGVLIGKEKIGVLVDCNLEEAILKTKPDVMVDFTNPMVVMNNIRTALANGVRPVVGTTGLTDEDKKEIALLCKQKETAAFIAPNFAIGAVLMMMMAQQAAKYLPHVEIIEMHHDQKLDAPSGTALQTAELISEVRGKMAQGHPEEKEKLTGVRGGDFNGIHIHSVRLPGYVAHQEVIFGGLGQTLTIRHDSIQRESFMPGVTLACKKVMRLKGFVTGLENLLD